MGWIKRHAVRPFQKPCPARAFALILAGARCASPLQRYFEIYAFSAWRTPGNNLGTALAHGRASEQRISCSRATWRGRCCWSCCDQPSNQLGSSAHTVCRFWRRTFRRGAPSRCALKSARRLERLTIPIARDEDFKTCRFHRLEKCAAPITCDNHLEPRKVVCAACEQRLCHINRPSP